MVLFMTRLNSSLLATALVFIGCASPTVTTAQNAGQVPDTIVSAQILPGWTTADGTHMAGLMLTMAPGWKTYWRAPGDSGIAPQFSWGRSTNLEDVEISWPRPKVEDINGLRVIGYTGTVVFPIEITPATKGAPVTVAAQLDLGVCEEVCVPISLSLNAHLKGPGKPDARILNALATLPITAQQAKVREVTCGLEPTSDGMRLTARLTMPKTGTTETVLIEAGDPEIWVSETVSRRDGNTLIAVADLVPPNAQPFALNRGKVRFTILGAGQSAVDITGCTAG
ncbi:MAG: DsbC/DsbD-like thiol-disulfide interchange protein [Paracoccaceae bacterium]|jgi:DsbC/DsbD-like thiol-disulfide interchange protein